MQLSCLLFSLAICALQADSANILGIFPLPGKSHFVMAQHLFEGLAKKGHNVDIISHFPIENPPPRYNQISIRGTLPLLADGISVDLFPKMSYYTLISFIAQNLGIEPCETVLNTPVLQKLKTSTKKYDLVITEIFGSDCMLGFGHVFKAPVVSIITSVTLPWGGDRIGNPDNPSFIPNYFLKSSLKMGLYDRVINTIYYVSSKILYDQISNKKSNQIAKEFFGEDLPDLEDLAQNTSLILVNSHLSMNQARPSVPNFIEVGGLHITEPKPLPKHLEDLLAPDPKSKGVIYLTMGSMIMTETFPVERLQGMFDAFAQLPYKVLWKAVKEKFPKELKFPKNIHFEPWMPQMDILCHPNVKLFVSHGGLMGSQEAVYCGVPRLGIPLFADQEGNIRNSEALGIAIRVDYKNITRESILEATTKLLGDPKYKQNAEKVSRQFKDRPLSALDTAIYWVEYVISHQGAPHLRVIGADLPWYQYYLIDVGAILLLLSLVALYISYFVITLFLRLTVTRVFKIKTD